MSDLASTVGPGLLQRLRSAGGELQWRDEAVGPKGRRSARPADRVRIAHLHDEEARVLDRPDGSIVVDSGPVGALVLLLEIDRRGPPSVLEAKAAGEVPGFGQGSIQARWSGPGPSAAHALPLTDVVALARYALV